jgi:hypothetical protein
MNKEKEYLDKIDIRVFNTLSGRQLVGELLDVHDETVFLNAVLECKRIVSPDGSYKTTFIPAAPFDDNNTLTLNLNSIESEVEASIELKQIYFNQLILNNITSLLSNLSYDKINDNQTNLTDLAKQDYWKDFKDKMLS